MVFISHKLEHKVYKAALVSSLPPPSPTHQKKTKIKIKTTGK
jgi:hypothetical protein